VGDKCPRFKADVFSFQNPKRIAPRSPQEEAVVPLTSSSSSSSTSSSSCLYSISNQFDSVRTVRQGVTLLVFFDAECCNCRRFALPTLLDVVDRWQAEAAAQGQVQVVLLGRGNSLDTLASFIPYAAHRDFPDPHRQRMPMASDDSSGVFKLFADALVPRWYVVDTKGIIRFQAQGFDDELFEEMVGCADSLRGLRSQFLISLDAIENKLQLWNVCPFSSAKQKDWMALQKEAPAGHALNTEDVKKAREHNDNHAAFLVDLTDDEESFLHRLEELDEQEKHHAKLRS
jgi:hypothetical protein